MKRLPSSELKVNLQKTIVCVENKEVTSHDFVWICNKVIHAKSFNLIPVGSHKIELPLEWWDGDVDIAGVLQDKKTKWNISFDATTWLKSCLYFVTLVEDDLEVLKKQSSDIARCLPISRRAQ